MANMKSKLVATPSNLHNPEDVTGDDFKASLPKQGMQEGKGKMTPSPKNPAESKATEFSGSQSNAEAGKAVGLSLSVDLVNGTHNC
jgi:hypothetical protein